MAEPLVRCIFVFGALTSDAPYIVGKDAPLYREISRCKGMDLSRWGHARQEVVRQLLDQAEASMDAKGLWRDNSGEAVAAMMV